jgi:hypothetical protein
MAEPLLLVKGSEVPSLVRVQAERYRAATDLVLVFGGTAVVTDTVKNTVGSLAGRQTALWGPTTPWEQNPAFPTTSAARKPGVSAGVAGTDRPGTAPSRPTPTRDLQSASQG